MSELLHLRESGMTNHQIAQAVGCAESTVYRYIGRRSQAVKYAAIQNKPCPVPEKIAVSVESVELDTPDQIQEGDTTMLDSCPVTTPVATPVLSAPLPVIKQICVYEMQGASCVFRVDTTSTVIEMLDKGGSVISGMIDIADVDAFVSELRKIADFLIANKA